eukprot:CAMPEP_0176496884 /NCGR_PEP_ID=MMETSP0200_2-20121128/11427_1 /TAXON_ID=947934 /ORGANISM="Chaetoceros sp., Strain GSL56" /LENGTH=326 /DNA_ID=CAMNT_0017894857 /DNA_START=1370 /DNA_END=2350 /DNA_ORIENTATION=+
MVAAVTLTVYSTLLLSLPSCRALSAFLPVINGNIKNEDQYSKHMIAEVKEKIVDSSGQSARHHQQQTYFHKCLEVVLKHELPILPVKDVQVRNQKNQMANFHTAVLAHHGDTGDWRRWNRAISVREKPLPQLERAGSSCSIWEVGANTMAESSREYMRKYPNCHFHAYEPVQAFAMELKKNWEGEDRMHVHAYGIADEERTYFIPKSSMNGDHGVATYIGDASKEGEIEVKLKTFNFTLAEAGDIPTMLDINCEGCEFDFLAQAKRHGLLDNVPVIQIGWHSYGSVGVGMRAWQTCEIRLQLSETHEMVQGLAFGWERWVLKSSQN